MSSEFIGFANLFNQTRPVVFGIYVNPVTLKAAFAAADFPSDFVVAGNTFCSAGDISTAEK
jgi:hypothetical protein